MTALRRRLFIAHLRSALKLNQLDARRFRIRNSAATPSLLWYPHVTPGMVTMQQEVTEPDRGRV
eukprot:2953264-Rhodomonas_salina.1